MVRGFLVGRQDGHPHITMQFFPVEAMFLAGGGRAWYAALAVKKVGTIAFTRTSLHFIPMLRDPDPPCYSITSRHSADWSGC